MVIYDFYCTFAFSRIDIDCLEMMQIFESKQLINNNVITQDIPCFYFFFNINLRSD